MTNERRSMVLTPADIEAIVVALKCTNTCPNGLTSDDTAELKALARWIAKAKATIGQTIIYGLIAAVIGLAMLGIGKFGGGK